MVYSTARLQLQSWCSECFSGDKLLRGLVFLGADGCLVDWWRSLRCLSPPQLYAAPSSKRHLTAKHPRCSADNTRAKNTIITWGCAAKLLAHKIENLFLCRMKGFFFHRSEKGKKGPFEIEYGREISHLSHLFPEADEQAVSVRGQSTSPHFCLCFALSWHKVTEGGPLLSLYGPPHT